MVITIGVSSLVGGTASEIRKWEGSAGTAGCGIRKKNLRHHVRALKNLQVMRAVPHVTHGQAEGGSKSVLEAQVPTLRVGCLEIRLEAGQSDAETGDQVRIERRTKEAKLKCISRATTGGSGGGQTTHRYRCVRVRIEVCVIKLVRKAIPLVVSVLDLKAAVKDAKATPGHQLGRDLVGKAKPGSKVLVLRIPKGPILVKLQSNAVRGQRRAEAVRGDAWIECREDTSILW